MEEDPLLKRRRLDALADKLVDMAMDGDVQAMKEVGDRLDGKAMQALEHSGPGGEPLPAVVSVKMVKPDA